MAIVAESLLRATGTYNFGTRLPAGARGAIVTANITAKGAGASTLNMALFYYDEASASYIALTDAVTAAPTPIALGAQAVTPTEQFQLMVYPSFGVVVPTAGKKRFFSAPITGGFRVQCVVAVDTITFSVGAKALY